MNELLPVIQIVGVCNEYNLNKDQLNETENGVQLLGLPFFWILQKLNWALNDIDALPSDFGKATKGGRVGAY